MAFVNCMTKKQLGEMLDVYIKVERESLKTYRMLDSKIRRLEAENAELKSKLHKQELLLA